MDIGTATGLGHLTAHFFVQPCHDGLTRVVFQVVAIACGDRCPVGRADAQHVDTHAFLLGFLGSLQRPTLVVFTIGDDDDGFADVLFLRKAVRRHVDGSGNVGALCGYHRRGDARQEHLRRHVVAGNGQLDESIAGKDYQTYLVIGEMVDQVLYHHLRAVQTAGSHVFSQHRVADVQTDNRLNAGALLVADFRAELRAGYHDDEQGQRRQQQPVLHQWAPARHVGHQQANQLRVAEFAQALLLLANHQPPHHQQQRDDCQGIQIYRGFKSKHGR